MFQTKHIKHEFSYPSYLHLYMLFLVDIFLLLSSCNFVYKRKNIHNANRFVFDSFDEITNVNGLKKNKSETTNVADTIDPHTVTEQKTNGKCSVDITFYNSIQQFHLKMIFFSFSYLSSHYKQKGLVFFLFRRTTKHPLLYSDIIDPFFFSIHLNFGTCQRV